MRNWSYDSLNNWTSEDSTHVRPSIIHESKNRIRTFQIPKSLAAEANKHGFILHQIDTMYIGKWCSRRLPLSFVWAETYKEWNYCHKQQFVCMLTCHCRSITPELKNAIALESNSSCMATAWKKSSKLSRVQTDTWWSQRLFERIGEIDKTSRQINQLLLAVWGIQEPAQITEERLSSLVSVLAGKLPLTSPERVKDGGQRRYIRYKCGRTGHQCAVTWSSISSWYPYANNVGWHRSASLTLVASTSWGWCKSVAEEPGAVPLQQKLYEKQSRLSAIDPRHTLKNKEKCKWIVDTCCLNTMIGYKQHMTISLISSSSSSNHNHLHHMMDAPAWKWQRCYLSWTNHHMKVW